MQNGNFRPRVSPVQPFISGFVHCVETTDADGNSALVPCNYPYEGLDGDSFDLKNQIESGVPLRHVDGYRATGAHAADVNNKAAESFLNRVENEKLVIPSSEEN